MNSKTPGVVNHGTNDESIDFGAFELSDADVAAAEAKADAFIDSQPEIEASDDCEGGACKI